jgi:purine-binding chemotaxis protein CheW
VTAQDETTYVTVEIAGQTFGVAIGRVREVFAPERLTRVPLAPREVSGVLNLRGRIVTAVDMRERLGLPAAAGGRSMAIGIDHKSEAFALLVDGVGDVMALPDAQREAVPATLDPRWSGLAIGVHRLDGRLMLILDVDRALEPPAEAVAA